jgi:hypothetical protein
LQLIKSALFYWHTGINFDSKGGYVTQKEKKNALGFLWGKVLRICDFGDKMRWQVENRFVGVGEWYVQC